MDDGTKKRQVYSEKGVITIELYDNSGFDYKVVICGPANMFYESPFLFLETKPSGGNFSNHIMKFAKKSFSGSEIKRKDLNENALPADSRERSFNTISIEGSVDREKIMEFISRCVTTDRSKDNLSLEGISSHQ